VGYLTPEELLAGSSIQHDIEVPATLLAAGAIDGARVRLRPLTVHDVQLATRAAKDSEALLSVLMLKQGMVEPALSLDQVHALPTGVARLLLEELNRISGLKVDKPGLADAVQAPMAKACFLLAREFGWSPQQVGELTLGQVLLYLELIRQKGQEVNAA
jgi:hypothetical protein